LLENNYLDKLNPQYNILKTARSSETKVKFNHSLKGVDVKEKSTLFGIHHTEKTKNLMSNKK